MSKYFCICWSIILFGSTSCSHLADLDESAQLGCTTIFLYDVYQKNDSDYNQRVFESLLEKFKDELNERELSFIDVFEKMKDKCPESTKKNGEDFKKLFMTN